MYLQYLHGVSDEAVVARRVENAYFQHFMSETFFRHQRPIYPSSLSRWRDRVGDEGAEWLLTKVDYIVNGAEIKLRPWTLPAKRI
jgi:IS5 family transposase